MTRPRHDHDESLPAVFLLGTALVGLGLASERWILVFPLLAFVALHPLLAERVRLGLGFTASVALALPFAFLYRTWEVEGLFEFNFFFYASLYIITFATVKLYDPKAAGKLPRCLLAGCAGVASVGAQLGPTHYLLLVAVFAVDALWTMRAHLRRRAGPSGGTSRHALAVSAAFAAAVLLSALTVFGIRAVYQDVNRLFYRFLQMMPQPASVGFSNNARLGSIVARREGPDADAIAVRAFGESPPGYLRGKIFLAYGEGIWTALGRGREFKPDRGGDRKRRIGRYVLPGRPAPAAQATGSLTVFPTADHRAHFFLPLRATAVDTASKVIILQPGNVIQSKFVPTSRGYNVFLTNAPVREIPLQAVGTEGADPVAPDLVADGATLRVPPNPAMGAVLDGLLATAGARGTRADAAVRRIRDYFAREYRYELGITFLPDLDPVYQFLTTKRHGHCELFASAGTLLLRRAGIPARYVTGYLCQEPGLYGGVWYARRKHAHAWVEYYTPEHGWRTAEFTPPAGVPEGTRRSGTSAFLEYLHAWWKRLVGTLMRHGISGLLTLLLEGFARAGGWMIGAWWRLLLLATLLGLYAYRRWFRRARKVSRTTARRDFPEAIEMLRKEFRRRERRLRRHGLGKHDGETLDEYADRLADATFPPKRDLPPREETVRFLRHFAARRYAPFSGCAGWH